MINYLTVHLYMDNEDETQILSYYEIPSNPFKLGDEVFIRVEDMFPPDLEGLSSAGKSARVDATRELRELIDHKWVKLVREGKWADTKISKPSRLTIEYHCEIIEK
jgi:hypothetical protein